MCIVASFSAFLTVEISNSKLTLPFESLEEMRMQSKYSICAGPSSYVHTILKDLHYNNILNTGNCKLYNNNWENPGVLSAIGELCTEKDISIFISGRVMYAYKKFLKKYGVKHIYRMNIIFNRLMVFFIQEQ